MGGNRCDGLRFGNPEHLTPRNDNDGVAKIHHDLIGFLGENLARH
jgi:hypothetical protein